MMALSGEVAGEDESDDKGVGFGVVAGDSDAGDDLLLLVLGTPPVLLPFRVGGRAVRVWTAPSVTAAALSWFRASGSDSPRQSGSSR
jgi:hypothetical protein